MVAPVRGARGGDVEARPGEHVRVGEGRGRELVICGGRAGGRGVGDDRRVVGGLEHGEVPCQTVHEKLLLLLEL